MKPTSLTKFFGTFLFGAGLATAVFALEIPVAKSGDNTRVGFVDMERIFQEYPETRKARTEYRKEIARYKNDISQKEKELEQLEMEIAQMRGTISPAEPLSVSSAPSVSPVLFSSAAPGNVFPPDMAISSSTPPPVSVTDPDVSPDPSQKLFSTTPYSPENTLSKKEADLLQKREALEKVRGTSVEALRAFEARQSRQILGRLYKALVQLADEQGISLVVDKSAILYGQDTVDLTEALSRRVRGLPEEAP